MNAKVKKQMIRLLALIPIVYVLVAVVVYVFQAKLVYFPSSDVFATPADIGLAFENVALTTADGVRLQAWYVPHATPIGTILFCHGNAGNRADRLADVKLLHRMGLSTFIFDYRGFGGSAGRPDEKGTYEDAEAAWNFLVEHQGLPANRIVLFGRSLGGAVAIELATRHEPGAMIVESTFTSLVEVGRVHYPLLPIAWLCRYRYDSIRKVGRIRCPKLFLHGTADTLVPFDLGRRLFQAAAEPKRFISTPGEHNGAGFAYSDETVEHTTTFLRAALGAD